MEQSNWIKYWTAYHKIEQIPGSSPWTDIIEQILNEKTILERPLKNTVIDNRSLKQNIERTRCWNKAFRTKAIEESLNNKENNGAHIIEQKSLNDYLSLQL